MKPTPPIRQKTGSLPPPPAIPEQLLEQQIQRLEEQFEKLRDQVRQTQQLATLGTAAAMMAHEYNNLMTPVVSYARYALDSDDPELMRKALTTTLRQGGLVSGMADRILGLAIHEASHLQPHNLKAVVDESIACMCRDPAKDGITLKVAVDENLRVRTDDKQLIQVFFNLLLNARDAVGRGGRITIEASPNGDDRVEIRVRDNGPGIPVEDQEAIFEPFFTTKGKGPDGQRKGSGLGLAICRDIITEQNGTITVQKRARPGHHVHHRPARG